MTILPIKDLPINTPCRFYDTGDMKPGEIEQRFHEAEFIYYDTKNKLIFVPIPTQEAK